MNNGIIEAAEPRSGGTRRRLTLWSVAVLAALAQAGPLAAQTAAESDLKRLVDRIAKGDDVQSADAADALISRLVGPLSEAMEGIEQRPLSEQLRLLEALNRVTAQLRLRLQRAELSPGDRALFDGFLERQPELVERLFHDDPGERLAALGLTPRDAEAGAGVLITAKLFDWDIEIVHEALRAARQMNRDPVTVRGLTRFITQSLQWLNSSELGPGSEPIQLVLGQYVQSAVGILADAGAVESVPLMLQSLREVGRNPQREWLDLGEFAEALGRVGSEEAGPALLDWIEDERRRRVSAIGPGKMITQTVGDAALLALAQIYKLDPAGLGFIKSPDDTLRGFVDEAERREARRRLRSWMQQNAAKPAAERTALSAPASQPGP